MQRPRNSYRLIVLVSILIAIAAAAVYKDRAVTLAAGADDRTAVPTAQSSDLWRTAVEEQIVERGRRTLLPEKYLLVSVDKARLEQMLARSPMESSEEARNSRNVIELPKPDGTFVRFRVEESPILSEEVARDHPTWKTYQAFGIDEPGTSARLSITDAGFHGYVFAHEGTFSIDPFQANDVENYVVFYKKDFGVPTRRFHCKLDELLAGEPNLFETPGEIEAPEFVHGTQIRTYRLAVATTSEYTAFFRQPDGDQTMRAVVAPAL